MTIGFRRSLADPPSVDIGNKALQENTVSKTIQFGLFTANKNAVWRGKIQLQKESYPFPAIDVVVNRDLFKVQVGDCIKFSYARYGVSNMICRVLQVQEDSIKSEKITLTLQQDVFSITNTVTEYTDPTDNSGKAQSYATEPFDYVKVLENPFILSDTTQMIALAARKNQLDIGFLLFMSSDDGDSYNIIDTVPNIQPFGTLDEDYGMTYTIDEDGGFLIDFNNDVDLIENVTYNDMLSGQKNTALLGDELISFQFITPITENIHKLEMVVRGRWGTQMVEHTAGEEFWFIPNTVQLSNSSNILPGADRLFKLVPYNIKKTGAVVDATELALTFSGESSKPYEPVNFRANDDSFNPLYISGTDIELTWTPRIRGEGCGVGIAGYPVVVSTDHEGFFRVEVYVDDIQVRDTLDIAAIEGLTWSYTDSMNLTDNTTQADEILFKLYNYRLEGGITYECDPVEVYCRKEG